MIFPSFFIAGFECSTGYNRHKQAIDQVCATQHDRFVDLDYRLLNKAGICAARDGVRWNVIDHRGHYDFSTLDPVIAAARAHGITVIYDLFHYGYPDDLDPFTEVFIRRFADYCYAAARYVGDRTDGAPFFTPVNEPSYFSWAGGQAGVFAPHVNGKGRELKVALLRAAIQGINAIWAACPQARIVNADPICRVVAPRDHPELARAALDFNRDAVLESYDILCGKRLPELGGSRRHLGVIGLNYYWTNQWELTRENIPLADDDPRRLPLRDLVKPVWDRYGGDIMITETSHVEEQRPVWLRELLHEALALLQDGVPLGGVCLYPILQFPEWHDPGKWTRMGLWDLRPVDGRLERVPYGPVLKVLSEAQARLEQESALFPLAEGDIKASRS